MLDQVLTLFDIRPDHDLDVMRDGQSPTEVAAAVLTGLAGVLAAEQPDWVLVQGDTTTAMAAAIGAVYAGARVGHVEAGLRTHDKRQPFPEEINRRVVGVVADVHFAPTAWARDNLLREGRARRSACWSPATRDRRAAHGVELPYDTTSGPLAGVPWDRRIVVLTTAPPREPGRAAAGHLRRVRDVATRYADDVHFVFPVHLTRPCAARWARARRHRNVTLTEPLDYLPLVHLLKRSTIVLTDSGRHPGGGARARKPVLVLREVTERPRPWRPARSLGGHRPRARGGRAARAARRSGALRAHGARGEPVRRRARGGRIATRSTRATRVRGSTAAPRGGTSWRRRGCGARPATGRGPTPTPRRVPATSRL
jgi:UDP-N-acetylglucosamine 2-epimerase (non-hydrolysing)